MDGDTVANLVMLLVMVVASYFLGYYHGSRTESYDVWREDWGDDGEE